MRHQRGNRVTEISAPGFARFGDSCPFHYQNKPSELVEGLDIHSTAVCISTPISQITTYA